MLRDAGTGSQWTSSDLEKIGEHGAASAGGLRKEAHRLVRGRRTRGGRRMLERVSKQNSSGTVFQTRVDIRGNLGS